MYFNLQPVTEVSTTAVLVPQQALESLVPLPPDKKKMKDQQPPQELGTQQITQLQSRHCPVLTRWNLFVSLYMCTFFLDL